MGKLGGTGFRERQTRCWTVTVHVIVGTERPMWFMCLTLWGVLALRLNVAVHGMLRGVHVL